MRSFLVKPASSLKGDVTLSGDKSIAHRTIILSAITPGKTEIKNFPANKDCLYTVKSFQKLGIKITKNRPNLITVFGKGLCGLKKPAGSLFVGDSGTTLRLILGILAGQNFMVTLTTGKSLSRRPMLRVTTPLRMMGAKISSKFPPQIVADPPSFLAGKVHSSKLEEYPPISIKGGALRAITYRMPIASAQVKSAILLAGLYARGITRVIEPVKTRDHTERMLKLFKAKLKVQENKVVIKGSHELVSPGIIIIPGDISSASFFMVAAVILPDSEVRIRKVSLNPSRAGIINVLKRMGADIKVTRSPCRHVTSYEPMGNLTVKSSFLKGIKIRKEEIPSLIDELPILMVAASLAKGKTVFAGVGELRIKQTDRIRSMSENLRKMGADIRVMRTGKSEKIIIKGVKELIGTRVRSFGDHRTAMSIVVAGLRAKGNTLIDNIACINKSFPDFLHLLHTVIK